MCAEARRSGSEPVDGWYLAELVVTHRSESWETQLVHVNHVLLSAKDHEAAYDKAMRSGEAYSTTLVNCDQEVVSVGFVGIRELFFVGSSLTDGMELFHQESSRPADASFEDWIVPKQALSAFLRYI